jgi:hypothetical protein
VADSFTFVLVLLATFLFPQADRAGLVDLPPALWLVAGAALSGNGLPGPLGVLALGFVGSVVSRALALAFPDHLEPLAIEEVDALPVSFVVTSREARGEACSVAASDTRRAAGKTSKGVSKKEEGAEIGQ